VHRYPAANEPGVPAGRIQSAVSIEFYCTICPELTGASTRLCQEESLMTDAPALASFTSEAAAFFTGLDADNSKAFFEAHRDQYARAIRQPLEDLLGAAEPVYGPGKVMRPNRDVRFSANKDPYRTEASMWAGTVGGVYLNLNPERLEVGGGLYDPSRDQLERARGAIAERPGVAAELESIIQALEGDGFTLAGPSLKTAPRGMDPSHPAIHLLRLKHYAALRGMPIDTPPSDVLRTWRAMEPLIAWVDTHVGPALTTRGH